MTRAETLAAIKSALEDRNAGNRGRTHWDGCVTEHHHRDCAIAWLLQEIEYLNAQLHHSCDGRDDAIVQLREYVLENARLRAEMARIDAHHVAQYLASRE